ncbi:Arylsulfatase A [bacterium A37T11]|nr:Arylsulfatase A [bacterium A37T11]
MFLNHLQKFNKGECIFFSLILSGVCIISTALGQNIADRPNIVLILADDMGYGDVSALNLSSKIHTPVMDNILKKGIHFTDAHSSSSVCTPTRYGLLTGRYDFRSRLKKGVLNGYSPSLIEKGRVTIASFLKKEGYHTGCFGKWHLGLDWQLKDNSRPIQQPPSTGVVEDNFDDNVDYTARVNGGPWDFGFEESLIIPASLDMSPYCYLDNGKVHSIPNEVLKNRSEGGTGRGSLRRSGKVSKDFVFDQVLPTITNRAVTYINARAKVTNEPFFLYLPLPSPHTPWVPTKDFSGSSQAGNYGDYVKETDQMIGKVIEALAKNGLLENTLVILTSDNGSDWTPEDISQTGHKSNADFRGRKADIFEAGHHVPFMAQWPGHIQAGSQSAQLICTTDMVATLAGMLHFALPNGVAEDSFNLWPAWVGKDGGKPIRDFIVHHSLGGYFAIRKGSWKLCTSLGSGGFTEPRVIKLLPGDQKCGTLFNLANDPAETNDVYLQFPEKVAELKKLLDDCQQKGYSRPHF